MKKVLVTLSLVLTLGLGASAQSDAFFSYSDVETPNRTGSELGATPGLPMRGAATDQSAPLGSGLLVLAGLGLAYGLKRREK